MVLLFVYGSMQNGLWNSFYLNDSEFKCTAKTVNKFSLRTHNHVIPKVSSKDTRYRICGELYEVFEHDLLIIDKHHGNNYQKRQISVYDKHGNVYRAYIYFNDNNIIHDRYIDHGNYKNYITFATSGQKFVDINVLSKYNDYETFAY